MVRLLITANVAEMFRDFLIPYGEYFRRKGWQVDAMANGISHLPQCAKDAFDRVIDIEWSRNPLTLSNVLRAPRTLRRESEDVRYDIVHAHTPTAGFISRFALRSSADAVSSARGPRLIYTAHGFHFHPGGSAVKNALFRSLEQIAGRWTDYLVVINRTDEAAARTHRIVPDDRLVYMPGIGIDCRLYRADSVSAADIAHVRSSIGLRPDDRMFLMIAEFTPGKRHRDALRAFARLNQASVHLVFAGEGPLMPQVRREAAALKIAPRVHFLGYRRDIPVLIRASAATLLPSEREGLPRSVMESLSLETPVIACDVRGCRDLLAGGAGLLVPVGDHERLAYAMSSVLADPDGSRRMARIGRRAIQSHDLEHILGLHEDLYEKALRRTKEPIAAYPSASAAPPRCIRATQRR